MSKLSYLEQVREDSFGSEEFWASKLVQKIGRCYIRAGEDPFTGELFYFVLRENKKGQSDSVVKISRTNSAEFMTWAMDTLGKIDRGEEFNLAWLSLDRKDNAFWTDALVLPQTVGNFRIRLCKHSTIHVFCMNNERKLSDHHAWDGPSIYLFTVELRKIVEQMTKLEDCFNN